MPRCGGCVRLFRSRDAPSTPPRPLPCRRRCITLCRCTSEGAALRCKQDASCAPPSPPAPFDLHAHAHAHATTLAEPAAPHSLHPVPVPMLQRPVPVPQCLRRLRMPRPRTRALCALTAPASRVQLPLPGTVGMPRGCRTACLGFVKTRHPYGTLKAPLRHPAKAPCQGTLEALKACRRHPGGCLTAG